MALEHYPTFSVVVPCYNVERAIDKCIQALLNQDYPEDKFSIVIVDDKSTDSTLSIIEKYSDKKQIKIVKHLQNRGLSAARNSGIKNNKADIIAFLDSDMVVQKDWAKLHLSELRSEGVVACMGGITLAKELTENQLDKFLYNPKRGALKHGENKPIRFKWFLLNNSSVKREAIKAIGLFDETISTYGGEDTDFAIRLWIKYPNGLRFNSQAYGEHYHQRSLEDLQKKMEGYGRTNYLRILERYPDYSKDLDGDWIYSFKGKIIFNAFTKSIVKYIYFIMPIPYLVRYFIAYSLILGARNPAEGFPKFND